MTWFDFVGYFVFNRKHLIKIS